MGGELKKECSHTLGGPLSCGESWDREGAPVAHRRGLVGRDRQDRGSGHRPVSPAWQCICWETGLEDRPGERTGAGCLETP